LSSEVEQAEQRSELIKEITLFTGEVTLSFQIFHGIFKKYLHNQKKNNVCSHSLITTD
jgi:hypothetical protein